jgi:hypothetical protein
LLGVSLIDSQPAEVLHLSLRSLEARYRGHCSGDEGGASAGEVDVHSIDLSLQHMQVDSAIEETKFKVMLASRERADGSDGGGVASGGDRRGGAGGAGDGEAPPTASASAPPPPTSSTSAAAAAAATPPFLRISVEKLRRWAHLLCCRKAVAQLAPLVVQLEQNTLAHVLRMAQSLAPAVEELAEVSAQAAREQQTSGQSNPAAFGVGDEPSAAYEPSELFLQELVLGAISLTLTMQLDPVCVPEQLQAFHPVHALAGAVGSSAGSLLSVESFPVVLPKLELAEAFETGETLAQRLVWYYSARLMGAVFRLISFEIGGLGSFLSGDALDALLIDYKAGVKHILSAPLEGLAAGSPRVVAASLGSGVAALTGGTVAYVLKPMTDASQRLEQVAVGLSRDQNYANAIEASRQERAQTTSQGIRHGARLGLRGVIQGVRGVIARPVKGARTNGAAGFVQGCGQGVVGLVATPLAGVAGLTAKATEGLASDMRRHTPGGQKLEMRRRMLRARQPRAFGADGVLHPYPRADAESAELVVVGGEEEDEEDEDEEDEEDLEEASVFQRAISVFSQRRDAT